MLKRVHFPASYLPYLLVAPQVIITLPLLEGLDGVQKMSKSVDNYVGIIEPPGEMFGKLMSISDELMWRYFDLLSFRSNEDIAALRNDVEGGCNVHFFVDFEFRNMILQGIIGVVFGEAVHRMVRAFESRADKLYGPGA